MASRVAMAAVLLAIPAAAPAQRTEPVRSISYGTSGCMRYCPIYSVTVNADGSGVFHGERYAAVQGERRFRMSRAQFRTLARHLAPYRPTRDIVYGENNNCQGNGEPFTDAPTYNVGWRGADGSWRRISYYVGCSVQPLGGALARIPGMLPIGDYIEPRH